jgi:hypothetical protein
MVLEHLRTDLPVVLEHARLERQSEEGADVPQARLGLGDEVLVAELQISATSCGSAELPGAPHFPVPLAREVADAARPRPVEPGTPAHVEERKRRVTAVADDVDVLRARKHAVQGLEVLHVRRRLVAEARFSVRLRVQAVDDDDHVAKGRLCRQPPANVVGRHPPLPHARDPPQIGEDRLPVGLGAVPVPELRDEVGLARDGELGAPVEHLLEERRPAPGDAEDDDRRAAHRRGCRP